METETMKREDVMRELTRAAVPITKYAIRITLWSNAAYIFGIRNQR